MIKRIKLMIIRITHRRHPCGMVSPFWVRASNGCKAGFDRVKCRTCEFYPKRGWYTPPWLNELYLIDKRIAEEAEKYLYGTLEYEIERIEKSDYPGHDYDGKILAVARDITLQNWHQSGRAGVTTGIRIAEVLRKNFKQSGVKE